MATDIADSPAPRRAWFADHLANERTHLAYVRTAIALFTFGISLNTFSTFIIEHQTVRKVPPSLVAGWRVGLGMVLFGIALALWSAWRFEQVTRDIEHGTYRPSRVAMLCLSLVVLILGAAAVIW